MLLSVQFHIEMIHNNRGRTFSEVISEMTFEEILEVTFEEIFEVTFEVKHA